MVTLYRPSWGAFSEFERSLIRARSAKNRPGEGREVCIGAAVIASSPSRSPSSPSVVTPTVLVDGAAPRSGPCDLAVVALAELRPGAGSPLVHSGLTSFGAIPLGLALPLRVHRISTAWRDSARTAKNSHPELIEKLTEGISNLTSSEEWQHYLDFQSRFHRYSFGNVLLIAAQCHEATQVAGFNAWRKLNRFVHKGEKAIWVLAPMVHKNSEAEDGEDERVIRGFKFVPVFDVAQTDGEELPSICNRLNGDDPTGHYATLLTVATSLGFTVEDHEFDGSTNGDCNHSEHRIRVETRNSPAQRVKTLVHEIAHALLHEKFESRALTELEAESTAYVVTQALGIDSSDYSFGYVATWAGGGDQAIAAIKVSCQRIQQAAATILRAFEPAPVEEAA